MHLEAHVCPFPIRKLWNNIVHVTVTVYTCTYHGTYVFQVVFALMFVHMYYVICYVTTFWLEKGRKRVRTMVPIGTYHGTYVPLHLSACISSRFWDNVVFVRTYVRTRVRTYNVMSQLSDWKRAHREPRVYHTVMVLEYVPSYVHVYHWPGIAIPLPWYSSKTCRLQVPCVPPAIPFGMPYCYRPYHMVVDVPLVLEYHGCTSWSS